MRRASDSILSCIEASDDWDDWDDVEYDQKTGKTYYWNQITGKTSWTVPGGLSPPKKILSGATCYLRYRFFIFPSPTCLATEIRSRGNRYVAL